MSARRTAARSSRDPHDWTRLEEVLARCLSIGVAAATALLCAGLCLWLLGAPPVLSARLLDWGLRILMATPMIRVLVSLAEFLRLREWFFALTTLAVVSVLVVTLVLAVRAG